MRNLKKILALVLALVMSFSIMTVSSATFEDRADVDETYAEAVDVLDFLGVFRGDENGKFNAKKSITRAEVAAIIYRIATGDVTDAQVSIYADMNAFSDVKSDDWFAGYVNYCASAQYIKGVGDGSFNPQGEVTGYQALAMILRAIGYDKNGEFNGFDYFVEVAKVANQRGITANLTNVALGSAVSREVVAELLFQTINVSQVSYTLAFGYSEYADPLQKDRPNETLGYEMFGLCYDYDVQHGTWGAPYHVWFMDIAVANKDWDSAYEPAVKFYYDALAEYTTEVCECEIANDLGLTKDTTFSYIKENGTVLYDVRGGVSKTVCSEFDGKIEIYDKTHTHHYVGAQGRETKIYKTYTPWDGWKYEIVMTDEFLAQVTDVTEIIYDKNGHVKTPATATVEVFDGFGTELVWKNNSGNFDYVEGEYLLLNAVANEDGNVIDTATIIKSVTAVVLGNPESLIGTQTKITTKATHIVDDVEYFDAFRFVLDEAGTVKGEFNWLFDTYGNLIGVVELPAEATQYVVLTKIAWVDSYADLANGKARANVKYADGQTGTLDIYAIDGVVLNGVEGQNADSETGKVSSTAQYNKAEYLYTPLYEITYDRYGRIWLEPTEFVADAVVRNKEVKLSADYYIGNATKILTFNPYYSSFDLYTGVKNVPTDKGETGLYWVVDENNDDVAEYVYIYNPSFYQPEYTKSTFYAYANDRLTYDYDLTYGYWTVYGGYVNGVQAEVYIYDGDVLDALLDNHGKLCVMTIEDGTYTVDVQVVTDNAVCLNATTKTYAVYGMKAEDAHITADGVLLTNYRADNEVGYDVEGTEVISYFRNLEDTVKYDEDAYLYIVYSINKNQKTAELVYITDEIGVEFDDALTDAIADVTAAQAELDAAVAALNAALANAGVAAAEADPFAELKAAVAKAQAKLDAALYVLNAWIAIVDDEWVEMNDMAEIVAAAEAASEEADEAIDQADATVAGTDIADIEVAPINVVYTVEADVNPIYAIKEDAVAAVKTAVEAALGYEVVVDTEFTFENVAAPVDVTFTVTVKVGEAVKTFKVVVNVTLTEKK